METRLANHYLQIAKRKIELYKNEIMCLYGYCADGNLPTWKNQENYIGSIIPTEYLTRPTNMVCHNLCENNPMSMGTRRLLGLGLKYCTLCARPTNRINQTIEKAKQDVRRMAYFKEHLPEECTGTNYIPQLYIKNTKWIKTLKASKRIEKN